MPSRPSAATILSVFHPIPYFLAGAIMNLQSIFQKSENLAVAVIFALFIISHFGLLYLLRAI